MFVCSNIYIKEDYVLVYMFVLNLTGVSISNNSLFSTLEVKTNISSIYDIHCKYVCVFSDYHPLSSEDYITVVDTLNDRGKHINTIHQSYNNDSDITIHIYQICNEEQVYLNLLTKIRNHGRDKMDRTRVGTRSLFGEHLTFSLENERLPALTSKKIPVSIILKELIWFLQGNTNNKSLIEQNVHIWDKNGSRDTLDKLGFNEREEGELGPIYGFQWRYWGAEYPSKNGGIDQINNIIRMLREDQHSRRMILSAWNVSDLDKMALPPCHMMCQFYVTSHYPPRLSCNMYQRSGDIFLGVPFNITSYALLTHIIAHLAGMKAHQLNMFFGDVHLYNNHVEQAFEQTMKHPLYEFPTVSIDDELKDIDNVDISHIKIKNYKSHERITADMAV